MHLVGDDFILRVDLGQPLPALVGDIGAGDLVAFLLAILALVDLEAVERSPRGDGEEPGQDIPLGVVAVKLAEELLETLGHDVVDIRLPLEKPFHAAADGLDVFLIDDAVGELVSPARLEDQIPVAQQSVVNPHTNAPPASSFRDCIPPSAVRRGR